MLFLASVGFRELPRASVGFRSLHVRGSGAATQSSNAVSQEIFGFWGLMLFLDSVSLRELPRGSALSM